MDPTANPPRRRSGRQGRWRPRLAALAALTALLTAGMAIVPGTAQADPCWECVRIPKPVPCTQVGSVVWRPITYTASQYVAEAYKYDIISTTSVLDVAYGRFNENRTDQVITGSWTATQARTVSMTSSFNFSFQLAFGQDFRTSVTVATGIQVTESHTTTVGVGATAPVPPHSTVLGEYGVQSLDVVFNARKVFLHADRQTCTWHANSYQNQTAHVPTINEGWRFTRI